MKGGERVKRASEWVVTWVSEERPGEEQEARFNTWEGAMSYYRELIDFPLFSEVHIKKGGIRNEQRTSNNRIKYL